MKSILITGCRRGLGLELIKQLVELNDGPNIIIATVRKLADAPELVAVSKKHTQVKILELDNNDVLKMDDFAVKVGEIVGDAGLNVILHNAGILTTPKQGTIEELTHNQLMDVYRTNAVGPIMLTKSLLPLLRKASRANKDKVMGSDRAAIFFISSFLGSHTLNDRGGCWGYRESKAAVNMAMCTLKIELAADVIGTMSFHPGWVKTDMGGEGAMIEISDSASGIIRQVQGFTDRSNGTFAKWDGSPIPW